MGLGGPVWHASARAGMPSLSWALADRALQGVGDANLGEWREDGSARTGVVHVRQRLTKDERVIAASRGRQIGCLEVRDIRGSEEEQRRLRGLVRDLPEMRPIIEALA